MRHRMMSILIVLVSMAACAPTIAPSPTSPADLPTPSPATGSISGRVIDAVTGAPIAGANVSTDPSTTTGVTAADGSYAIDSVPPGTYTVTATSGMEAAASVQVAVDAGTTTTTDLHLRYVPKAYWLAKVGVTRNTNWTPYTEKKNDVLMALVPAGCFMMGSEDGSDDEKPVHQVCFEKPFWFDVYEVTQVQFGQFGGKTWEGNWFREDAMPRDYILWSEANVFCRKRGARLPTEAEWEYAARGPDALIYPWGNEFIPDNLVYDRGGGQWSSPSEVGSRPGGVSWVGAYDLSGNVREWINDWYSETYYGTLADGVVSPQGPETGLNRVVRSSSYQGSDPNDQRAAARTASMAEVASPNVGFRCTLSD